MKIVKPEPFTFEAGPRAVLLLHGFTGHSADVRMMGRYLEKKGYTSHAPIYKGHGVAPEELIKTTPDDWWEDALEAYEYLQYLGYNEIAIAGLSLGGAMTVKLAAEKPVKGIVPMCTPMFFDNASQLQNGFEIFSRQYKQFQKVDEQAIDEQVTKLLKNSDELFQQLGTFIDGIRQQLKDVHAPALVVQAEKDEMVNPKSAEYLYEHIASDKKNLEWFHESGHVITTGPEREQLHEDVLRFLESLNWEQ